MTDKPTIPAPPVQDPSLPDMVEAEFKRLCLERDYYKRRARELEQRYIIKHKGFKGDK